MGHLHQDPRRRAVHPRLQLTKAPEVSRQEGFAECMCAAIGSEADFEALAATVTSESAVLLPHDDCNEVGF
jgi:hypothetical protein